MASPGITLPNWGDFYRITGPVVLSGPASIANEAQNRSYLISWWLNHMSDLDMLKGGNQIREYPMIDTGSTAQNTLPGAVRSVTYPNVMSTLTAEWRMTEDVMGINEIIINLNKHGADAGSMMQTFKYEMAKNERRLATSLCNKLDADWAVQPDVTKHVGTGTTALDPTSLWEIVNEFGADTGAQGTVAQTIFDTSDARFPYNGANSNAGLPSGYTTISGIDTTVLGNAWYRCWQLGYNGASGGGTTQAQIQLSTASPQASDLLMAFMKATNLVQYQALPWRPGESTENNPLNNPEYCIPVSTAGQALIQKTMLAAQNFFRVDPQDPYYPNPRFAGIPFLPWANMDGAKVFPSTSTATVATAPAVGSGQTEAGADNSGPRFPIISKKWLRWFFHTDYYFYFWPTKYPSLQWDTEFHPVTCLHNRMATSRRKLAMVFPLADVTI